MSLFYNVDTLFEENSTLFQDNESQSQLVSLLSNYVEQAKYSIIEQILQVQSKYAILLA